MARSWLKNSDAGQSMFTSSQSVMSCAKNVNALAQLVSLPKIDIGPFDGDMLKFHAFMNAFHVDVESVCTDPNSHLAHLIACTCGPALEAVRGCQVLGGLKGCDRAMETLKGTFGSNQMIVHKVIYSLHPDKVLCTAEQVSQLSFQLINARDILTKIDAMGEVNA